MRESEPKRLLDKGVAIAPCGKAATEKPRFTVKRSFSVAGDEFFNSKGASARQSILSGDAKVAAADAARPDPLG